MFDISEKELDSEIKGNKVILDLWAPWCAPCRAVTVVLNSLEKEYPSIKFCKINIDENPSMTERFKVYSLPTVLGFSNGELVSQLLGAKDKNKFKEMLDFIMQN